MKTAGFAMVLVAIWMLLAPFIGLVVLYWSRRIQQVVALHGLSRQANTILDKSQIPLLLLLAGWSIVGLSLLGIVALGILAVATLFVGEIDAVGSVANIVEMVLLVVITMGGYSQVAMARLLRKGLGEEDEARYERNASLLSLFGWTFVALPVYFFGPSFLAIGILPLFFVAGIVMVRGSIKRARQGHLLWLLAIAVQKGFPLPEELDAHARTLRGRRRRREVENLAERLRSGNSLSEALTEFSGLLPQYVISATRIGEETGTLGIVLGNAAVRQAAAIRPNSTANSFTWFLLYYWSVVTAMVVIVSFIMYWIVPKFRNIFEDFGVELPLMTVALIHASDSFTAYALLLLPLFSLPGLVLLALGVGYIRGWGNLKLPWLTRWFPRTDTPDVLRNLAQWVAASRPLPEGLAAIAQSHHRLDISKRLSRVEAALNQGGDCWESLNNEGMINEREQSVLKSAQRVGNLSWALQELADGIDRRHSARLSTWFEIIRPILVVGIGLLVGFVAVAMFLPLVNLVEHLTPM